MSTSALDPAILDQLTAYATRPRGNRSLHVWTVDELLILLNPAIPALTIAAGLGVAEHVVTYELVRMRRAGLPVPTRRTRYVRSERTIAIEADLRAGMPEADVARRHGVRTERVGEVRRSIGLPSNARPWTDEERAVVIEYQHQPVREVAEALGRPVRAVYMERQNLIARGLLQPKIKRPRKTGA